MYLDNKYTRVYYAIINKAQSRNFKSKKEAKTILNYVERHHIIPKSLSGDDSKTNLVYLTAREHFICHWLLTKMVDKENVDKMEMAIAMMRTKSLNQYRYNTPITSKVFEKYRHLAAKTQSNLLSGRKQSQEHIDKRANAIRGIKHTDERKKNISASKIGSVPWNKGKNYKNPAISAAKKGIPRSKEHAEAAAKARVGQKWWNNGIIQTRASISPGNDYVRGRLR